MLITRRVFLPLLFTFTFALNNAYADQSALVNSYWGDIFNGNYSEKLQPNCKIRNEYNQFTKQYTPNEVCNPHVVRTNTNTKAVSNNQVKNNYVNNNYNSTYGYGYGSGGSAGYQGDVVYVPNNNSGSYIGNDNYQESAGYIDDGYVDSGEDYLAQQDNYEDTGDTSWYSDWLDTDSWGEGWGDGWDNWLGTDDTESSLYDNSSFLDSFTDGYASEDVGTTWSGDDSSGYASEDVSGSIDYGGDWGGSDFGDSGYGSEDVSE